MMALMITLGSPEIICLQNPSFYGGNHVPLCLDDRRFSAMVESACRGTLQLSRQKCYWFEKSMCICSRRGQNEVWEMVVAFVVDGVVVGDCQYPTGGWLVLMLQQLGPEIGHFATSLW